MSNERDIPKKIQERFHDSGIMDFLAQNSPEMTILFLTIVIPKETEALECLEEIKKERLEVKRLNDDLIAAQQAVQDTSSQLRPWETDKNLQILNIVFDWILKAGMASIPVLAMFTILGLKISSTLDQEKQPLVMVSLFAGIALVWKTSSTVIDLVLTTTSFRTPCKYQFFKVEISSNSLFFLIVTAIWIFEALSGFALIPSLIDASRVLLNEGIQDTSKHIPLLNFWEKIEILLGVSVFAFVNIISAIAKGRVYRLSTPRKQKYMNSVVKRDTLLSLINKGEGFIQELEKKAAQLQEDVNGYFSEDSYVRKQIQSLSVHSTKGQDYDQVFKGIKYRNGAFDNNDVNGFNVSSRNFDSKSFDTNKRLDMGN